MRTCYVLGTVLSVLEDKQVQMLQEEQYDKEVMCLWALEPHGLGDSAITT